MQDLIIILGSITASSFAIFVVIAILWLRKWRENVVNAMAETANQNIRTAQRLSESIAQLQKQQRSYEDQLLALSQSNVQLRQGLVNVATRLDHSQADGTRGDHTVH